MKQKFKSMKQIITLSAFMIFFTFSINAQCRRNEIGIGVGIFQMVHRADNNFTGNIKDNLTGLSRIHSMGEANTKKTSSRSFPAIYYGYKITKNNAFRMSLNTYQEKRALDIQGSTSGNITQYNANFNQFRLATGLSRNLSDCSCMKTYFSADLVHYVEFAREKGMEKSYNESGNYNGNQSFDRKTTRYSIGFNPSIGIRKQLCHNMSVSYEAGAELKYNTGKNSSLNMICTPLNRLSLNCKF